MIRTLVISLGLVCANVGFAGPEADKPESRKLTPAEESEQYLKQFAGEKLDSIRFARIQGWESIDDDHLVLWTSNRDAYLLTLVRRCLDLEFRFDIAVTSMGQSIYAGFDSVIYGKERCRIAKIQKIDLDAYRRAKSGGDSGALDGSEQQSLRPIDAQERDERS